MVRLCHITLVLVSLCGVLTRGTTQVEGVLGSEAAAKPRLQVQSHTGGVQSAVFSPDGRFVLTIAGYQGHLWETTTGRELRRFAGHRDLLYSGVFSSDGRTIMTASQDKTVRLWDAVTGRETQRFQHGPGFHQAAALSPDGRTVLTTGEDGTPRLWDAAAMKELRRFEGHTLPATSAVFSPDSQRVLTGSVDQTARLWDVDTGHELRRFAGHTNSVTSTVFSPDGRSVLTGSVDQTARLWDVDTGHELRRLVGHTGQVSSVVFSPDGRTVLTASHDQTACLWDVATGQELRCFEGHAGAVSSPVSSAVFSPDGRSILTASWDGSARLWDTATGQELRRFEGYSSPVASASLSPDGSSALVASLDRVARLWDLTTGRAVHRFVGHDDEVYSAIFSPNGQLVLTASRDGTARVWDFVTRRELRRFEANTFVNSAVFSPDGGTVLTAGEDGSVRLWDMVTERELRHFEGHTGRVASATFSSDGRWVLTASWDETARLWDVVTGQELRSFIGHDSGVNSAAFSHDGTFIITASLDETARLWDVVTGKELRRFQGHRSGVYSAFFSLDDMVVLSGSWDRSARFWDARTGQEIRRVEGHTNTVTSLVSTNEDNWILTTSWDGTTRLWNAETGTELARLVSFTDGTWVVATPEGRFDTNNLEEIKGLHWLMPDDPLHALPLEIFMRDYFEPRLLPRVLGGNLGEFKAVRPLQELNRAQPKVLGIELVPGAASDRVDVEVEVAGGVYENATTGKKQYSSVHDLRLFRDGQLVGQCPELQEDTPNGVSGAELAQWRADTQVVQAKGSTTVTFRGIRLPHRGTEAAVEFSAYAFNEDRVKGETARTKAPAAAGAVTKRAYLVAVGVDDYGHDQWNLHYAAKDAREMVQELEPRLRQAGYEPQVALLGPDADQRRPNKKTIRAAIEELVGVSTPDDVVILFFSGHGYSGEQGAFYLLPGDSQPSHEPNWRQPSPATLARSISAEELSRWMRKVVAAEIVLIIDACHSAASVEGEGFKPGPLGSKGLGQLAYDKRMRVLAASQSDQAAREMGGQIGAGVLTYALVHDALQAKQAADANGTITLTRWLEYPVTRVPKLFEEIRSGTVNDYGVAVPKDAIPPGVQGTMTQKGAVQVPALFDYARGAHSGIFLQGTAKTGQ